MSVIMVDAKFDTTEVEVDTCDRCGLPDNDDDPIEAYHPTCGHLREGVEEGALLHLDCTPRCGCPD
jgi:hypothetical protein